MVRILIAADICPIEGNRPFFEAGDAESLFHELGPDFEQADLSIANLECPLIERPSPVQKTGPTFGESPACLAGIRAAGIDVLALANNHILDHGSEGLRSTLAACEAAGIATVGAGENLAAARRILIRQVGDLRVGVLAVAEREFSIAGATSWGANPVDLIDFVRNVRSHRDEFDYLVVLFHGAHEFQTCPSPRIRNTCRFMVEMGANAVVVQHPHSLAGYEEYQGGHIVYGQGALIMDEAIYRQRKSFHEGFLVKLSVAGRNDSRMELVPLVQSDPVPGARRMPADRARGFLEALAQKSRALLDDAYVESAWIKFCQERQHAYLSSLLGHGRVLRKLNARGLIERLFYSRRRLLGCRNVAVCETHREAIETIFDRGLV